MEIVMLGLEIARRLMSRIGPYLVVEFVLPGGTLFALLLYWYRRQSGPRMGLDTMSIRRPPDRL